MTASVNRIAALFVATNGVYFGLPGVDPWDVRRDARLYEGPHSVVAHPPCERWGRYWSGGPSVRVRKQLGDDGGCFAEALKAVTRFGGVLEHPAHTHAWKHFGLLRPTQHGWQLMSQLGSVRACVTEVAQGNYDHPARKLTWLLYVGVNEPPILDWRPCENKQRLDEGFHSAEERRAARAAGQKPRKRLSKKQNTDTPLPFRDLLISLARSAR